MITPSEIIAKHSVEDLCLTADNYFRSIQNPVQLMAKPFNSLVEAPDLLRNMGEMLSGLHLGKTMTVLEFAAGTCWFSRYLNQLQCRTISCDASETALEIGRRSFHEFPIIGDLIAEPLFLHFDGHKIDLPSESVDRIICHDGFHHVPNQDEVISELGRVLKQGGIAAFSEPGRFHSQSPTSQYEMRNFKVLENDIIIDDIFNRAVKYGFTDIKLRILNDVQVSLDEYLSLIDNNPDMKLLLNVLNNICNVMNNKTIFFLYKGSLILDSRSHVGLAYKMSIEKHELSARSGEKLNIKINIYNNGTSKWLNDNIKNIGVVNIGTHLYDKTGNLLNHDFSRHPLGELVEPGQSLQKDIDFKFNEIGEFKLCIDLVSEWVCWFENVGCNPIYLNIDVI